MVGNTEKAGRPMAANRPKRPRFTRDDLELGLLGLPAFIWYALFSYLPMFGIVMSFQDFVPGRGFLGSRWVGLKWFKYFVSSVYFGRLLRNTVLLSVYSLLFGMPMTILFALLLNELRSRTFKRIVQTVTYLPYFISTVIMVSILQMLLSYPRGVVNSALSALGLTEINFFQEAGWFRTLYIGSGIWQGLGWSSIIYLAALTNVDPQLMEAAVVDGANRFQRVWNVSLPALMPTISIQLIFSISGIMSASTEKTLLLYNEATYEVGDVIGTYVYREGILGGAFEYTTAIGLLMSIVSLVLITLANYGSRLFSENSLW